MTFYDSLLTLVRQASKGGQMVSFGALLASLEIS